MKRAIFIAPVLILLLSASCVTKQPGSPRSNDKTPSWSQAVYCQVDESQVCAVAQSDDDCKKLGGQKVSRCQLP